MALNRTAALCLALAGLAFAGCNESSTVTTPDTSAPLAPANVSAYTKDGGRVLVKWAANGESDLAGYNVYLISPYTKVNSGLISASEVSCNAKFSGTGSYRVTAVDFSGNESAPSRAARVQSAGTPGVDGPGGENQRK